MTKPCTILSSLERAKTQTCRIARRVSVVRVRHRRRPRRGDGGSETDRICSSHGDVPVAGAAQEVPGRAGALPEGPREGRGGGQGRLGRREPLPQAQRAPPPARPRGEQLQPRPHRAARLRGRRRRRDGARGGNGGHWGRGCCRRTPGRAAAGARAWPRRDGQPHAECPLWGGRGRWQRHPEEWPGSLGHRCQWSRCQWPRCQWPRLQLPRSQRPRLQCSRCHRPRSERPRGRGRRGESQRGPGA